MSSLCPLHLTLRALQIFKYEHRALSPLLFLRHPLKALSVAPFAYTPGPRPSWPLEPRAQAHPIAYWGPKAWASQLWVDAQLWDHQRHSLAPRGPTNSPLGNRPSGIWLPAIPPGSSWARRAPSNPDSVLVHGTPHLTGTRPLIPQKGFPSGLCSPSSIAQEDPESAGVYRKYTEEPCE